MGTVPWAIALALALCGCVRTEKRTVVLTRVTPTVDPACGAPATAQRMRVSALGEFAPSETTARLVDIEDGAAIDIRSFPPATRALAVEVLGPGGDALTVGRTDAFDFEEISDSDDGEPIPVFMAPRDGFCRTGPPAIARRGALAHATAGGAFIVGGFDATGAPVDRAELYDHGTGSFHVVEQTLYADLTEGLAGAALVPLPGDRLLIAGGNSTAFQVWDGAAAELSQPPSFLPEGRAFAAAVALPGDRVLLAGGCFAVEDGVCATGSELTTTSVLDLESGDLLPGPTLSSTRVGGRAVVRADGTVALVGGIDDSGAAAPTEIIDAGDPQSASTVIGGAVGAPAALVSGEVALLFAPTGAAPSRGASAIGARGDAGAALPDLVTTREGPALVALEGGQVLVVGGAASAPPALWSALDTTELSLSPDMEPAADRDMATARLYDGSVLLFGGTAAGDVQNQAWIFRGDTTGPDSPGLVLSFADVGLRAVLPSDPTLVSLEAAGGGRPVRARLESAEASGGPSVWVVLAGPEFARPTVEATLSATGSVAILFRYRGPAEHDAVVIRSGGTSLVRVRDGVAVADPACTAGGGSLAAATRVALSVDAAGGGEVVLSVGGSELMRCPDTGNGAGLVGVGVVGDAGAVVEVDQITAGR